MPRHAFIRRQRRKALFAEIGLDPDVPRPFAASAQLLGQGTALMALPTDVSQQYPLMNSLGQFWFRFGIDHPNSPDAVF